MSFTQGHALQCDCDSCLNRGGGQLLAAPRVIATPPERPPSWRCRGEKRPSAALEYAKWKAARAARVAAAAAEYVEQLSAVEHRS